jgi:hypothetical protein
MDPMGDLEVDFTPEKTGLVLFHCHRQLHMGDGFRALWTVLEAAASRPAPSRFFCILQNLISRRDVGVSE